MRRDGEMPGSEFFFRADDGVRLLGRRWLPDGRPKAIVQIAHGLAEHSARYARLAAALTAADYGVYANDHRGHGPSCGPAALGHFADADSWAKCVGDLWTFNRQIAAEQTGAPIVFFGHSMGSFLGQHFVSEHSEALAGVAYSGSGKPPPMVAALRLIARAERLRLGRRGKSTLVIQLMFALQQALRAGADQVRLAVARYGGSRRLCRRPALRLCVQQPARDRLPRRLARAACAERLARIRKDLPIYVFSGERDPIGANIPSLIAA